MHIDWKEMFKVTLYCISLTDRGKIFQKDLKLSFKIRLIPRYKLLQSIIHYLIFLPCSIRYFVNFLEHTYKQHVDIQTAQGSLRFKLYSVYLNI